MPLALLCLLAAVGAMGLGFGWAVLLFGRRRDGGY